MVAALLLIACANVGNLLLSRALARLGEFSIRIAIGASRFRVIRQLATESLVLAAAAGFFGVFCAWGGIVALDHFYLANLPRLKAIDIDIGVLALALTVSTAAGLVFGMAPAWLVSRQSFSHGLKEASQQQTGGTIQRIFQDGLVVIQVSLAVVLLAGAGLMIQSTVRLLRVNPGLDPKGLYRVWYDKNPIMKGSRPDFEAAAKRGLARREAITEWFAQEVRRELQWNESLVAALNAIPGIESAAINGNSGGAYAYGQYRAEGREEWVQLSPSGIGIRAGDYFRTLRLPLVAGRLLTVDDCVPGQQSVVINQELARRCWPGQNPLGKRLFTTEKDNHEEFLVVGVVKDLLDWRKDAPQQPTFYHPLERNTKFGGLGGDFVFRSSLPPDVLRDMVARLGRESLPATTVEDFYSIDAQLYASTTQRRVMMWLLDSMGCLGLLLSGLGIYAVLGYAVVRRTKEIGVRMALGAASGDIARLILKRGGRLVLNGMALGLVGGFTLVQYMESLLYQVKPGDPWVFLGILLTLGAVAGIACYLPSRRAAGIDPVVALRHE
jgi:ABC-type lipoprotein release transport system permease subunit